MEKEGMISQEKSGVAGRSLLKEHKFMLSATVMVVLATLFVISLNGRSTKKVFTPPPVVTAPIQVITATPAKEPSTYASSAAILNIEKNTRDLINNINNTDYQEPVLNLPVLEMRVDFFN